MENLENEIWKEVKDYPLYKISNYGRVKSFTPRSRGRILNCSNTTNTGGYYQIVLYNSYGHKIARIHRMVADAFIDNPENLREVNHINGIKTDNLESNLHWCSSRNNQKHAYDIGLKEKKNGVKNGMAKLTEDLVREIRSLEGKYTTVELGVMYNIHPSNAGYIINRKTWKHVK